MEQASETELFRRRIEVVLEFISGDIFPLMLRWLAIALLFIGLAVLVIRSSWSMTAASIWLSVLSIGLAGVCLFLDFWASFGEAFTHGINRYRLPIDLTMTVIFFAASLLFARHYRRNSSHEASTVNHPSG